MKKAIYTLAMSIGIALILWMALSVIEIASKNKNPNPEYSSTNLLILLFNREESEPEVDRYTAFGRYYTDGTVITEDGNEWSYSTETISGLQPKDNMPVWVAFEDNGTPDEVTDDIILGLVYDRETAIYDDLETALSDKFELERDGNNIRIGGTK